MTQTTVSQAQTCSNVPIISTWLAARLRTGLIMRAKVEKMYSPGYWLATLVMGTRQISSIRGTCEKQQKYTKQDYILGYLGHFPFVRTGWPDRSVRKRNVPIWRIGFILVLWMSSKLRVPVSEWLFFKILLHHPSKMTHWIYRLASLAGQFWQMESTLSHKLQI